MRNCAIIHPLHLELETAEINVEAIQRTPLRVSSQLIKLAHVIKEDR